MQQKRKDIGPKRTLSIFMASMFIASIFVAIDMPIAKGINGSFGGGDGTVGNPYLIEDVWDLQNMSSNLSAFYILKNDINASATINWNSGAGFEPVGTDANTFTGVLDGRNHTVKGLFINRSGTSYIGLFGSIGTNGSVMNMGLLDSNITGNECVGGLVGDNYNGTVNNSYSTGNMTGTDRVGGLVGLNYGMLNHSYATGNVTGINEVGGLLGTNAGTLNNSYAKGNAIGSNWIGGLAGYNTFTIDNSYATGKVNGTGIFIGGLTGQNNYGTINHSYATGNVAGPDDTVGGLVGQNYYGPVNHSYATGNVTGLYNIGGLIGMNTGGTVNHSYATGNVTGNHSVGGLIGQTSEGTVTNSYATGNVTGTAYMGGLMGQYYIADIIYNSHYNINGSLINGGCHTTMGGLFQAQYQDWFSNDLSLDITDYNADLVPYGGCYNISSVQGLRDLLGFADESEYKFRLTADIDLFGASGLYIPYLVADFDGNNHTISNLYINLSFAEYVGMFGYNGGATISNIGVANICVNALSCVGGLVGFNVGAVNNSYAGGNLTATDETYGMVGGLVGYNYYGGAVNNSHAAGNVTGTSYVGGLVGESYGPVNSSYATANVTATDSYCGGLVGRNEYYEFVNNSYATGNVAGTSYVGGLVGNSYYGSMVQKSYATGNVTGTGWFVGGLVGQNYQATVNNSFSSGKVNGSSYVGGLVGYTASSALDNSYSTGNVTGTTNVGGLVGYKNSGTVNNSFWDKETSDRLSSAAGTGKTTAEMKTLSTFTNAGWDFTRVWCMLENATYPLLRWQDREIPTANAGSDRAIREDTTMTFNGTLCSDDLMISNYTWTFSDGVPVSLYGVQPTYRFDNPGLFNVTLNVTDPIGHWDTDTMSVTVSEITPPVANAGPDQIVDEGTLLTFNGSGSSDNVGVVNYTWTFTDQAPVTLYDVGPKYQFDHPGIFVVTLNVTDAAGNWDNDTMIVTVKDITAPDADADVDMYDDEGALFTFNGSKSSDNVGIVNFTWTFIDGGPVTLYGVKPTYVFDNPGEFLVTLNVTDAAGNCDTDTMNVTVNDITAPVAEAGTNQTVEKGTMVVFDGSGSSDNVAIVNYKWTFTDGGPVAFVGVKQQYKFDNLGIFVVTLEVFDGTGKTDTDTMTVIVNDMSTPVANAGPDQIVDEGTPVTFNGSGSFDDIGIVNYTWTFSDKVPVALFGVQPVYRYDNAGVFIVTLNVTDAGGNWDNDTMTVTVNDLTAPSADAGPDQTVNEGTLVMFDGSGSSDNVGVVNYSWSFMDGAPVTLYGVNETYLFENPGIFVIALNVTDTAGHRDTDAMTVTVNDVTAPVADASPDQTVDEGTSVTFTGSGSSDNVRVVNYTWNFIDIASTTLYGVQPTYKFDNPGVFVVTLNVSDAAGNWGTNTICITVNDITAPIADTGPNQAIEEDTLWIFNASGSNDNVGIVNLTWTFFDRLPVTLFGVNPVYNFSNPGTFLVTLNVTDAAGNRGTDTMKITVNDVTPPIADAGQDQRAPVGTTVLLNGSRSIDNDGIGKYIWNFTYVGNTKSLEGRVVAFTFDKGGVYEVLLTVKDLSGNSNDDKVVLTVIDTGEVTGTVFDKDGKPVEGATVEITASNGMTCTTKTAANGTFSVEIYHGPFTWNITKGGYKKISGNSLVKAMDEDQLDLSDHPLKKQDKEGPFVLPIMSVLVIILVVVVVAVIGGLAFIRKRKLRKGT